MSGTRVLKLGILGLNEGNGHPFSYSAIFNGYDAAALEKRCPFPVICEYLPREHRNEIFIEPARVTHVWTQDPQLSADVAAVAKIPHIVTNAADMIGQVDAVLIARDDTEKHLEMARPFLTARIPLFVDKQLTASSAELIEFLSLTGKNYPLMAGSSVRYSKGVASAGNAHQLAKVKSVHGTCPKNWMRYGHHLLEGVVTLWGLDIEWVRSLSNRSGHDTIQLQYRSGLSVVLEFIEKLPLPIQFTAYSEVEPAFTVPFDDFFHSFREMLKAFVQMLQTSQPAIPFEEIVGIARVVLAGELSKQQGGNKICPQRLVPLDAGKTWEKRSAHESTFFT